MSSLVIYIILLAIYHNILFYDNRLGFNALLFVGPLLFFIYNALNRKEIVKNKKGFLFMIPIALISISYFIYDNYFFRKINPLVTIILFLMMYIFTIKPSDRILELLTDIVHLFFCPISYIFKYYKVVQLKIDSMIKLSNITKNKVKSIFIIIPIVFIVIWLLSSADEIFNNLFNSFFSLFDCLSFDLIIGRLILGGIIFTYLGVSLYYLVIVYSKEDRKKSNHHKVDDYTIKLLLTVLNIIYVVFDFIQIRSLIFQQGLKNINYAQYARSGFFQLMFISIINLIIILIARGAKKDTSYNKNMSILMVGLTFIIIVSSFLRMYMYESAYGYTLLRLLVYVSLITEVILLVPTVIYIINPKFNVLKYYIIIVTCCYTLLALFPVDYFIANNNINRYYKTGKIDISYLLNDSTDNIPLLYNFYMDPKIEEGNKTILRAYLNVIYERNKERNILEYNISREYAIKKVYSNVVKEKTS